MTAAVESSLKDVHGVAVVKHGIAVVKYDDLPIGLVQAAVEAARSRVSLDRRVVACSKVVLGDRLHHVTRFTNAAAAGDDHRYAVTANHHFHRLVDELEKFLDVETSGIFDDGIVSGNVLGSVRSGTVRCELAQVTASRIGDVGIGRAGGIPAKKTRDDVLSTYCNGNGISSVRHTEIE